MPLFEVDESGTRKFYRLELDGKRLTMQWGRIGTDGQTKVIDFPSADEAKVELERQRRKRLDRGYTPIRDESVARDAVAARASAEKERLTAAAPLTDVPRFLFRRAKAKPGQPSRTWLEQHDHELWSSVDDGAPAHEPHPSAAEAKRALDARVAKLVGEGWTLDAFGVAEAKAKAKAKKAKKPAVARTPAKTPAPPPAAAAKPWPPPRTPGQKLFAGYTFAFFGEFAIWPAYHDATPAQVATRRGGGVATGITEDVDVVVFGDLRGAGRAEAKKKVDARLARGARLLVLDEAAYRDVVRIDLTGKRFAFAGGFGCSPSGVEDGTLARMVQNVSGVVTEEIDEQLDFLVVGQHRGPSKIAMQNRAEKLVAAGAQIHVIDESAFLELVRVETLEGGQSLDFPTFLNHLHARVDEAKLGRAMTMLRSDRHQLFASHDEGRLVGVVKSQSGSESVYASHVRASGEYGCAQPDLSDCMGLQGKPCKHLLVLVVGLVRAGELPAETALAWMRATRGKRPRADGELSAETFLRYKGAQAGEIDWRPTVTIPEDYYAV